MRRILHVIPGLAGGGAERQLTILASVQAQRGNDVHIALLRDDAPREVVEAGAHIHHFRASGNHDPRLFWRLHAIMRRTKPDLVQTWLTLPDVTGGYVAKFAGIPWILSERSEAAAYPPSWKHRARIRLARGAGAIIANSGGGREYWLSHGMAPSRVHVIHNAVAVPQAAEQLHAELPAVFANRPLILFAGRFSAEKNPFVLVDALAEALRHSDAMALLCGAGPLEEAIRSRVGELRMQDRIILGGHRGDVPALMRRAQVCAAVSVFEGNPNVVLEAMAVGCPLVVSDIPAYTRLLDDTSARIVPVDNSQLIAEAILSVLRDPESALKRAAAARSRLARRSPDDLADAHENVYAQLV